MNIDTSPLERATSRVPCTSCGKPRKHYCYTCLELCGLSPDDIPNLTLPLECHIVKHLEESASKSTAVHAHLLSRQVSLFDYPGVIPPYVSTGEVVVCFPYPHALTVNQHCEQVRRGERREPKILLVLDGTWSNVQQIAQLFKDLPAVKLTTHETTFWRRHLKHIPNSFLSTIEAIYFFYKEYSESMYPGKDSSYLDGLLFFFSHQQSLCSNKENNTTLILPVRPMFSVEVEKYLRTALSDDQIQQISRSLPLPPRFTTLRVNTLHSTRELVMLNLKSLLPTDKFSVSPHPKLSDALIITGSSSLLDSSFLPRVVVDRKCGKAVLRGADVFSPGIKGLPHLPNDTNVAVYVDIDHKCKRGEKKYSGEVVHVANGVTRMNRRDIFKMMVNTGVAVEITSRAIEVPSLNGVLEDQIFLQNLPSIVTSHVLDPQLGERILDMCAAPGGKTTHVAQLMRDQGLVIALERVGQKVEKLKANIEKQGLTCVSVYKWDATQAFNELSVSTTTPPFGRETFDRILLDPPCSALGQRPQLTHPANLPEISSFPSYQWGFLADAIAMLKVGGTLVYSTCTFPAQENEMQIARVVRTFPGMQLVPAGPLVGERGIGVPGLSGEQCAMVQRFTPRVGQDSGVDSDTIGFFIAKFIKVS